MVGAQLDVIDQDIFFIRPDTLQQLVPSLNQYFKYAERLVNGNNNRASMGGITVGRPQMQGAPMIQTPQSQRQSNPVQMNPHQIMGGVNLGPKGSPMMSPAIMHNSPAVRPNSMSPQIRAIAPQMNTQVASTLQNLAQQITMYQTKHNQIQQQLIQIQNMRQNPNLNQETQQNLQFQQQELMNQQKSVTLALNQLTQQYRLAMDQMKNANAIATQQQRAIENQQMAQMYPQMARPTNMSATSINMMNPNMGINPSFQVALQNSPQIRENIMSSIPQSSVNSNGIVSNSAAPREQNNYGTSPPKPTPTKPEENQNFDFSKPTSPLGASFGETKMNQPAIQNISTEKATMDFGFGSESFMNNFHQQKFSNNMDGLGSQRNEASIGQLNGNMPSDVNTIKTGDLWDEQLNFGTNNDKPAVKEDGKSI